MQVWSLMLSFYRCLSRALLCVCAWTLLPVLQGCIFVRCPCSLCLYSQRWNQTFHPHLLCFAFSILCYKIGLIQGVGHFFFTCLCWDISAAVQSCRRASLCPTLYLEIQWSFSASLLNGNALFSLHFVRPPSSAVAVCRTVVLFFHSIYRKPPPFEEWQSLVSLVMNYVEGVYSLYPFGADLRSGIYSGRTWFPLGRHLGC